MLRIAEGALARRRADRGDGAAAAAAGFFFAASGRSRSRFVTSDGGCLRVLRFAARASRAVAPDGAASRPMPRVPPSCSFRSASSADARHSRRLGAERREPPSDTGVAGDAAPRFAAESADDRADAAPRDTAADAPSAALPPLPRRPVEFELRPPTSPRPPMASSPRTLMDEKAGENAADARRGCPRPRGVRRPVDGGSVDGVAVSGDTESSDSRVRDWWGVSGNEDMLPTADGGGGGKSKNQTELLSRRSTFELLRSTLPRKQGSPAAGRCCRRRCPLRRARLVGAAGRLVGNRFTRRSDKAMKKGDKDDDDDDAKPGPLSEQRGAEFKAEAKEDETAASSDHKLDAPARALGEDVPLEDLGEYWKGTDGLLRRATAHIYRKIIAPACEGGFREWFDDHCEIFDGSSKSSEHKPEFFVLYKEFEAKVSAALEEFVLEQFDDDGQRAERMAELTGRIRAGAEDSSKLKLPIDKSATMLLAAADYGKFCGLMRSRNKALKAQRAAPGW